MLRTHFYWPASSKKGKTKESRRIRKNNYTVIIILEIFFAFFFFGVCVCVCVKYHFTSPAHMKQDLRRMRQGWAQRHMLARLQQQGRALERFLTGEVPGRTRQMATAVLPVSEGSEPWA